MRIKADIRYFITTIRCFFENQPSCSFFENDRSRMGVLHAPRCRVQHESSDQKHECEEMRKQRLHALQIDGRSAANRDRQHPSGRRRDLPPPCEHGSIPVSHASISQGSEGSRQARSAAGSAENAIDRRIFGGSRAPPNVDQQSCCVHCSSCSRRQPRAEPRALSRCLLFDVVQAVARRRCVTNVSKCTQLLRLLNHV